MAARGLHGAAFNAAKEVALDHFIAGSLAFSRMAGIVEETLARMNSLDHAPGSLEDVLEADASARRMASLIAGGR